MDYKEAKSIILDIEKKINDISREIDNLNDDMLLFLDIDDVTGFQASDYLQNAYVKMGEASELVCQAKNTLANL